METDTNPTKTQLICYDIESGLKRDFSCEFPIAGVGNAGSITNVSMDEFAILSFHSNYCVYLFSSLEKTQILKLPNYLFEQNKVRQFAFPGLASFSFTTCTGFFFFSTEKKSWEESFVFGLMHLTKNIIGLKLVEKLFRRVFQEISNEKLLYLFCNNTEKYKGEINQKLKHFEKYQKEGQKEKMKKEIKNVYKELLFLLIDFSSVLCKYYYYKGNLNWEDYLTKTKINYNSIVFTSDREGDENYFSEAKIISDSSPDDRKHILVLNTKDKPNTHEFFLFWKNFFMDKFKPENDRKLNEKDLENFFKEEYKKFLEIGEDQAKHVKDRAKRFCKKFNLKYDEEILQNNFDIPTIKEKDVILVIRTTEREETIGLPADGNKFLRARFDSLEERFDSLEERFDSLEERMDKRFKSLEEKINLSTIPVPDIEEIDNFFKNLDSKITIKKNEKKELEMICFFLGKVKTTFDKTEMKYYEKVLLEKLEKYFKLLFQGEMELWGKLKHA